MEQPIQTQTEQEHHTAIKQNIESQQTQQKNEEVVQSIPVVQTQQKKEENMQPAKIEETVKEKDNQIPQKTTETIKQVIQILEQPKQEVKQRQYTMHYAQIFISQIIQTGSGFSKQLVYHINGSDNHGPIDAYRKYSEFQALDNILYERWPASFIPFFTNKIQIKNQIENEIYVKDILANYLKGLSYSKHLYYKEEVQLFLRCPMQNINQMFSQMPALKTKDVISRFRSCFQQQIEGQSQPQNITYIKRFTTSLRKIASSLQVLTERTLHLAEAYQQYSKNLGKYGLICKKYEKLCLSQYVDDSQQKMIVTKYSDNKLAKLEILNQTNPFYQLYALLYNHQKDSQAFIQIIIASELFELRRDQLDTEIKNLQKSIQQLALGGTTLMSMTTRKPKQTVQAQLQTRQVRLVEERGYMVQIYNILEIILAKKTINLFKTIKREQYKKILSQWILFVEGSNRQVIEAWQTVNSQIQKVIQK